MADRDHAEGGATDAPGRSWGEKWEERWGESFNQVGCKELQAESGLVQAESGLVQAESGLVQAESGLVQSVQLDPGWCKQCKQCKLNPG